MMKEKKNSTFCQIVGLAAVLSGNETTGYYAPRRQGKVLS